MPPRPHPTDDVATLLALGILAYLPETLLHEAAGHGGLCHATGGTVTALAPLWMRCSVVTPQMVLAGPLTNFLVAGLFWVWLRWLPPAGVRARLWGFLSLAFNGLVACGYPVVGGATRFGDWGVLIAQGQPAWLFRGALVVLGAAGFYGMLWVLAALYRMRVDGLGLESPRLRGRTLLPSLGAAVVALSAELVGHRDSAGALGLALACTAAVGLALSRIEGMGKPEADPGAPLEHIERSWPVLLAALLLAGAFVVAVGPAHLTF